MVEAVHFSNDSASTADALFLVQQYGSKPGTTDQAEIHDTVTLSAAALVASRSSNLFAFPSGSAAVIAQDALGSVSAEFPVAELIERGYSASQIAIVLGIPAQVLDAELGIQPFATAA